MKTSKYSMRRGAAKATILLVREFPHTKIAAMTGWAGTLAHADEARMLGVSSVLRKPLDLEGSLQVTQGEFNEVVHSA